MRTSLVFLLIAASCSVQQNNATADQKPVFTDLIETDPAQITVEVRFVTASPTVFEQLKTQDLIRTEQPATTPTLPSSSDEELAQQGGIQLVSAKTIIEQRQPVFIRSLTKQQMSQFMRIAQSDERSNIMFAPKVTVFDQQEAMIQDTTQRPFVVGLTKAGSEYQPRIETVDNGIKVALKATVKNADVKNADVRLDLAIRMSDVQHVTTRNAGPEGTAIQVPSVKATTVELSALLSEGKTLAIYGLPFDRQVILTQPVPYVGKVPYVGRLFKNTSAATEHHEILVLITPRIIKP